MFDLSQCVPYIGQLGSAYLCWSKKNGWHFTKAIEVIDGVDYVGVIE